MQSMYLDAFDADVTAEIYVYPLSVYDENLYMVRNIRVEKAATSRYLLTCIDGGTGSTRWISWQNVLSCVPGTKQPWDTS